MTASKVHFSQLGLNPRLALQNSQVLQPYYKFLMKL